MVGLKTFIIKSGYRYFLRPVLFLQDAEAVHNWFTATGKFLGRHRVTKSLVRWLFSYQHSSLSQTIGGITFKNPVGLAAGFDKDANLPNILEEVGFGFIQVGTVTAEAYAGNPKPRIYRLPRSKGAVIYFGLKNVGVERIIDRLKGRELQTLPLSVSVGKTNSSTTIEAKAGVEDYYRCLKKLLDSGVGDFYTINISCPNTFGGEPFTTSRRLESLLAKLTSLKISQLLFLKMPINLE